MSLPLETLLAMAGFAFASSATPGPVNLIGAMTGARFGPRHAVPFVTGATLSFVVLLVGFGFGLPGQDAVPQTLLRAITWVGATYLLWMAWQVLRDSGDYAAPTDHSQPSFWSGVLVQGLNPKAWLAVLSSLATFVLPLQNPQNGLMIFAALYAVICWGSLFLWAWGGAKVPAHHMRLFNRILALALIGSVLWMLSAA
jgi:threonine/homoserine/homoserine lactone efflux protein